MATRMQQRRGTSTDWATSNPVLAAGELGFESDSGYFKIGDGVNQWADLPYFESADVFTASLADYIELAEKGAANGVAELDANGNVPINQLGNIIDGAPGVLDTLNELAAALNDDADFFTTITTSISSGDSTTLASAQAYTDNALANFTTLPDQTGNSGEYLTTDGTTASWAPLSLDKAVGDLTDVTLTTPADGDALVYDANTATWVNGVVDVAGAIATANEYTDNAIAAIPPTDLTGYATESYVGTAISNLVDSAPATLDTLNELAAALGDDANFATTVTNSLATKANSTNPEFSITGTVSHTENAGISFYNEQYGIISGYNNYFSAYSTITSLDLSIGSNFYFASVQGSTVLADVLLVVTGVNGSDIKFDPVDANDASTIEYFMQNLPPGGFFISAVISQDFTKTISATELGYIDNVTSAVQTQIGSKADKLVSFVTKSGSATLALTDADKMVEVSAAATITVPTDASVAFPVGTTINITQTGTGTVTVAGASGVTLNYTPSNTLRDQWSSAVLVKRAANNWLLSGDLL